MISTLLRARSPPVIRFSGINKCRRIATTTHSLQRARDSDLLESTQSETTPSSMTVPYSMPGVSSQLPPTLEEFTLIGKVAVITSGGRGVSLSMAQAVADAGANAIALLGGWGEDTVHRISISKRNGIIPVRAYSGNLRSPRDMMQVMATIENDLGSLDVLIHAMPVLNASLKERDSHMPSDKSIFFNMPGAKSIFYNNGSASFFVMQAFTQCRLSKPRKHEASIIFMAASGSGRAMPPNTLSAFNSSKAAVVNLCKSLSAEWARDRIRVNCISIKFAPTGGTLQKKLKTTRTGRYAELEAAVVWLASSASKLVTGCEFEVEVLPKEEERYAHLAR